MLLYMSTIGSILGTTFKYTYTKICRYWSKTLTQFNFNFNQLAESIFFCLFRCRQPTRSMPAKASLPSALVDVPPTSIDSGKQSKRSSSRSKLSSNNSSSDVKVATPFIKHFKSIRKKKGEGESKEKEQEKNKKESGATTTTTSNSNAKLSPMSDTPSR